MKKRLFNLALVALVLCLPMAALAQNDAGMPENDVIDDGILDSPVTVEEVAAEEAIEEANVSQATQTRGVVTYWGDDNLNEVEKGFFLNTRMGALIYFGDMADYAEPGFMYGLGFGYDIMEKRLSLELDAMFSFHGGNIYEDTAMGYKPGAMVKGDFSALRVPIALNIKYYTTKRFEAYVSVTGGLNYSAQAIDGYDAKGEEISGDAIDFYAGGRLGVEYYTGLRHFSIGFEAEFDYMILNGYMALVVSPMLKYTF